MKTQQSLLIFISILLLSSCSIFRKAIPDNRTLQEKVESKSFTIAISHSNPSNLRDSYLGNDVEVRMKNDSIFANLPFFGVANTAPMDQNDGGINIEKPMKDFLIKQNSQSGWNLIFKVNTSQYKYVFRVDIDNQGKAIVFVTSTERSPMTYYGEVQ